MKKASEASELQRTGMMALVFGMQTKTSTDLRAIFQSFDSDSSGSLSRAEFLVAIQQLSPELTTADSNILFDTIDVDHNQQISYTEFLAATIDPREIDLDELSKAFHLLDEDGNGFITQAELTKVRVLCRVVLSRVVDVLICLFPSFLVFLSVVIRC
jgi:calcium-dependent protein kinase